MKRTFAVMLPVIVLTATLIPNFSRAQASAYAVTKRGPDWNLLSQSVLKNGTNRVQQCVKLATGLNYTNEYGQLVASEAVISILPQGGAAATQGRHKAYFPGDIYPASSKSSPPMASISKVGRWESVTTMVPTR